MFLISAEFVRDRATDFSNPTLSVVSGPVGECSERAPVRHPCRVPPASVPAGGDDLAEARCVPLKHGRAGVVGIAAVVMTFSLDSA